MFVCFCFQVFVQDYKAKQLRVGYCPIIYAGADRASCEMIEILEDKFTKNASIIMIGSFASKFIYNEQPVEYHASRAALESLTKYYAVGLGGQGVRCNYVLLGTVIKEENRQFFTRDNPVTKLFEEITPLKKLGNAIDIAHLVEFLCSDKASFITGQCISVDGGLSVIGQESIARRLKGLLQR